VASAKHAPGRGWKTRRGPLAAEGVGAPYAGGGVVVEGEFTSLVVLPRRRGREARRGWWRSGETAGAGAGGVEGRGLETRRRAAAPVILAKPALGPVERRCRARRRERLQGLGVSNVGERG
jgi:hypothetical protein